MRIMRRPGLTKDGQTQSSGAGTTESSVAASKAGSENDEENPQGTGATSPTESMLAKDSKAGMSRAEREARYTKKREELFGPLNDTSDGNEPGNEISRVSSRSEKHQRKKKAPSNDDFEGRSEFFQTMNYPPQTYSQAPNSSTYFAPYGFQGPMQPHSASNSYNNGVAQPTYSYNGYNPVSTQMYPPTDMHGPMPLGFGNSMPYQGYEQPPAPQYVTVLQQPPIMAQSFSPLASPSMDSGFYAAQPEMQTPRNAFSHPYHQHETQQLPAFQPNMTYVNQSPQPPNLMNGQFGSSLPNTLPRPQNFNPQIRSFVPTNASPGIPTHGGLTLPLDQRNYSIMAPSVGPPPQSPPPQGQTFNISR